ncbi:hypothetical protein ACIQVK_15670 [Streptomyces sp. NPDC090493]|uniref:hypothetical protein n=1 Tax=Streptomyces sp. NPDC090493 TaxID=3365964 RepID=UPI003802D369
MNGLAPIGPPEVLASRGVPFRLHEHPDVTGPVEICAVSGVPLERAVRTLAFAVPGAATASTGELPAEGPV